MNKKRIPRPKNIDRETIDVATSVLDGWSGKLTWELLCQEIEKRVYIRYTRQALNSHKEIKLAYKTAKARPPEKLINGRKIYSDFEAIESDRIERLKAENERLKAEVASWQERYNRWVYNAYSRGLSEGDLERPLPKMYQ